MKGNDGAKYKSTPDTRGIHTWKKLNSTRKATGRTVGRNATASTVGRNAGGPTVGGSTVGGRSYKIHNNGSYPYTVIDYKAQKRAVIMKNFEDSISRMLEEITYLKFWAGSPSSKQFGDWVPGNTVLMQVDTNKYVAVVVDIIGFELEKDDEVQKYMSPIGNNDVPYPYIVGKTHVYLLAQHVILPKESLDLTKDVYEQYYGINEYEGNNLKATAKKLKTY
jgi:hypothetical protein